jgi:EAL domain-containing protein (putative c-di-GMP-specific phosphodiesterase class I)/GGDEF domain-containing protein
MREPLEATVRQALALTERRFITVSEPAVPELRNLTRAMNLMVDRLRTMFDEQAGQVEAWRKQANGDSLTGVSNRSHFMARLKGVLNAEDGSTVGILVLVRVVDLQGLNRRLGRLRVDALLARTGEIILEAATRTGAFESGRLSGSDFAVLLTDTASLKEPSNHLATRLREQLLSLAAGSTVVVSSVRWWPGASVASLLAASEHALARAESRGPSALQVDDSGDSLALGEDALSQRLDQALLPGQPTLVEFPLLDIHQGLMRLECSLRLQWEQGDEPVPTAVWLPFANRLGRTTEIDLAALELTLKAIDRDRIPRSLRLCAHTLQDPDFLGQLSDLLTRSAANVPGLWLEVDESVALRDLRALDDLSKVVHEHGGRLGLEHAGEHLLDPSVLLEIGLDFVKLDSSLTDGLARDEARTQHVAGSVRMFHGIGLRVYAEVAADQRDAPALWQAGVDGVTGAVVTL